MRIFELVSGAGVNGATVHAASLVRELCRRGHDVTVVCRPGAWIGSRAEESGARSVSSDMHRIPPDQLRRIAELCRRERPDVLHTHMSRANFFGVLLSRLAGVPCVATAHSQNVLLHWFLNDAVIAVSASTARFLSRYRLVPASRLHVVRGFVEAPAAPPSDDERLRLRTSLGLGERDRVVGTAAQLIPAKGVLDLVRAVGLVRSRVPTTLVVAGSGEPAHEELLRAEAARLGVPVRWLGFRADLGSLLPAFDLFATATHREAFGMVALEAMAAGLPVVATDVGGLPEVVENGVSGLLVPRRDPASLAAALERVLLDDGLARSLGAAGRRRVLAEFTPQRQVPKIEEILERAASPRPGERP